jgi:23S rRNA (uracil1939-C5)-methyltransferase
MININKNDMLTTVIEGYGSAGDGVARHEGRAIFVSGALRGETCKIRVLKVTTGAVFAKLEEIIERSPHRVEPECPHFRLCGGCDFLHMDYDEELYYKKQRVEDALARIGGVRVPVELVPAAGLAGYRNKVIFEVGTRESEDGKTESVIGFYRPHSHDVIDVQSCAIQAKFASDVSDVVRTWMAKHGVRAYDGRTREGTVRYVFCRYAFGTNTGQVAIVSAARKLPATDGLVAALRARRGDIASVALIVNKSHGNTALMGDIHKLYGEETISDTLCGFTFRLSPRSFYQVNRDMAQALYEKVTQYAALTRDDTAIDLYCGIGTITLALSRYAGSVIGAEVSPDAVRDATYNAEKNGVENVKFILADATDAARQLLQDGVKPTVAVVDPPRKGLSPDVIDAIAEMKPKRIVYVSCDPATLARDLKLFEQKGYITDSVTAFDMFPKCAHVECVVRLTAIDS